jgi:hypothetical protein
LRSVSPSSVCSASVTPWAARGRCIGMGGHQDEDIQRIAVISTDRRNETEIEGKTAPAGAPLSTRSRSAVSVSLFSVPASR